MATQVNSQSNGTFVPTNNFGQAISEMELVLNQVLNTFVNTQSSQEQMSALISNELVQGDVSQSADLSSNIQKEQHENWWDKLFTDIGIGVMVVVLGALALTGQVEMLAVMVGMIALTETGALGDIAKGIGSVISDTLQAVGVPKEQADEIGQVLGDVITIAAVMAVALLTGAGAGKVTEEAGVEVAEGLGEGASEVAEGADEAVEGSSTEKDTDKKSGLFNKKSLGLAFMAGSQATMNLSNNMMTEFADLVTNNGKNAQMLGDILTLLVDVAALAGGIGGTVSAISGSAISTTFGDMLGKLGDTVSQGLGKAMPEIMSTLADNVDTIQSAARKITVAAGIVEGTTKAGVGSTNIAKAFTRDDLAGIQEIMSLINLSSDINNSRLNGIEKRTETGVEQLGQMSSETNYFGGLEAAVIEMATQG